MSRAKGKVMTKKTTQNIVKKIAAIRPELYERFTVTRIGVFGSHARGDQSLKSDVDILVEFGKPTFDNYMELKFLLEEVLHRPVDLVMSDTVKLRIRTIIDQEVVYA